eukprot:SAG11_NODE_27396_length_333_cov_0.777778_1_plen_59_part_10
MGRESGAGRAKRSWVRVPFGAQTLVNVPTLDVLLSVCVSFSGTLFFCETLLAARHPTIM